MRSYKQIWILLSVLLILSVVWACNPFSSDAEPTPPPEEVEELGEPVEGQTDVPEIDEPPTPEPAATSKLPTPTLISSETDFITSLISDGDISVDSIEGNSTEEDTFGPILTVKITNNDDEEVEITIPCGLIFTPEGDGVQQMMVVQESSLTLQPGETGELTPYVVCIDITTSAPEFGYGFSIGEFADGELATLASCACQEELPSDLIDMEAMGLQMAAWQVSDMSSLENISGEDAAALEDLFGEEGASDADMTVLIQSMLEMFKPFAGDWIDRCEIELPEE